MKDEGHRKRELDDVGGAVEPKEMRTVKDPARRGTVTSAQARAAIRAVDERRRKAEADESEITEEESGWRV